MSKSPEELFEEHRKLARNTVYKMFGNPKNLARKVRIDPSDINQMAEMGLWRACQEWKPEGGRTFKNYAISRIRWEIKQGLIKDARVFRFDGCIGYSQEFKTTVSMGMGSMDEQLKNEEESNTLHDVIGNGYDLVAEVHSNELEEYIKKHVSPDIYDMVKMKSKGETLSNIGEKHGLSGERVRQKILKVRKLLEHLEWEVATY